MKRKLISYDVFESILSESLSASESELAGAVDVLGKTLDVEELELLSFGPEDVMYESLDGSFIHANYQIKENNIQFTNIEQIVIDESSEKDNSRSALTELFDAILEDKSELAEQKFEEFMGLPMTRRTFTEGRKQLTGARRGQRQQRITARKDKSGKIKVSFTSGRGAKSKLRGKKQSKSLINKRVWAKKRAKRSRTQGEDERLKRARAVAKRAHGFGMKKEMVKEWSNLCENIFDFISYKEVGPVLSEAVIEQDDNGNVVSVAIPTLQTRNEQKLLSFDWNTMKTDVDVLRSSAHMLSEDNNFCKAVAELKRHNAISDSSSLEETLENIVSKWPSVLYLTQNELAETIKTSLETVNATNFDDQTCEFMAEGILRAAHNAYVDRVSRITRLAGGEVTESEDKYDDFKKVVDNFYPTIDEGNQLEMQMFVDLYEALRSMYELSDSSEIRAETEVHLEELAAIVQQEMAPSLEVAEAAALWLSDLIETNLEGGEWNPSNSVHTTVSGDHPEMMKKARQSYSPSSDFTGDWGDGAPVSDGKSYKGGLAGQMRSNSWGNIGGNDNYPSLSNPYVPKPFGDFSMKGEKGVDKSSDATGQWSSGDTWPSLQNPYVPSSEVKKMNHGKEADLVVDR